MRKNSSLLYQAERLRRAGQGDDTILAHIHPIEAAELKRKYGGDINPYTGLPQYGFKLKHVFKGVQKIIQSKPMRAVLPIVAGAAGFLAGGPAGAAVGAGVGRAVSHRDNFAKNLLKGGLTGGAIGAGASVLGGATGSQFLSGGQGFMGIRGPQTGMLGKIFGTGPGSLTSGLSNFGGGLVGRGNTGRMDAMNSLRGVGQGDGGMMSGGEGGGLFSGLGGGLNTALLGAGLAGTMMRREKVTPHQISDDRAELERLKNSQPGEITTGYNKWGAEYQPKKVKPSKRKYMHPVPTEGEPIFFDEVNPETEYMAYGGYVHGNSGGAQDNRRTRIPEGSYVMNATDVSLLGDGNSNKGAEEIAELERRFLQSGLTRNHGLYRDLEKPRYIDVQLSDGEYPIDPRVVTAIGKGNNNRGAKIIDKGRRKLRHEKGMKHILPPRSKPFSSYLR